MYMEFKQEEKLWTLVSCHLPLQRYTIKLNLANLKL